jgi:hypothetical protein
MPQGITFAVEHFIAQVLTLLHQLRMSLSHNAARRTLNLHFANSRCPTARSVVDEIAKLQCKRVAPPPYSSDLAIRDFYLFSPRKDKFAGFHGDNKAGLLREVQEILTVIHRIEVKKAFGHWIERYQWVAMNKDEYYPEE